MIDEKLIAAYQWIVDTSQIKPRWWAEQSIMALTAIDIVRRVVTWKSGWDAVWLFIALTSSAILIMWTRNEVQFKSLGEWKFLRVLMLSFSIFHFVEVWIADDTAMSILLWLSSTGMTSYYYFAACTEPKPRRRKEKLVLSTS